MRLSALKKIDVVLDAEKELPKEQQTVFNLRQLTGADKMMLAHQASRGATDTEVALYMVNRCLVGWENMLDEHGNPLRYSKDNVDLLSVETLTELATLCYDAGLIHEEDKKK